MYIESLPNLVCQLFIAGKGGNFFVVHFAAAISLKYLIVVCFIYFFLFNY